MFRLHCQNHKDPENQNTIYNVYAFSAYHYLSCEFASRSWRGVLDTTLCDKVCQ